MTNTRLPIRIAIALSIGCLAGTLAAADTVNVLDMIILGESRLNGEKFGEFSSLLPAANGTGVLAISDRGYVARLDVDIQGDDLIAITPVALNILVGPDGRPLADADFNAEAAALLPDGNLAIVDETSARLAIFDSDGVWLHDDALPEALRDVRLQSSDKDGVEALVWTELTGFIAMTEEPQAGEPRNRHTIHSSAGLSRVMQPDGTESISIKGMEAADGHLFILERTRDDVTNALSPYLRIIDLATCEATSACVGTTHPIPAPGITDADFEGIASLSNGRFLIVSDDKIDGDLRSVFLLVAVD